MGNCQAIDAAALVVQHPDGRLERMYWSVCVSEVMKMNPGHYVSLIIPLPVEGEENLKEKEKTVQFTRVKLLRPSDRLVLGKAYRLVTSQEVMRVLREKKYAKMNRNLREMDTEDQNSSCEAEARSSGAERPTQAMVNEGQRQRQGSANIAVARSKSWRPSLQSISEAASPGKNRYKSLESDSQVYSANSQL
ncbi:Tetratricopeptide repeat protein like [Heracleum sosnowskyi]|uniref:Tetratricopeptide repeat protein like n=1 Tax=Heracleum sosnowskyi TaxID=360622 RepID=A0AAD8IA56_9APIA|nr:Tetratricopeptide repeat protein like [Heracleum sosnowskyi]